jgi:hypothetical protein
LRAAKEKAYISRLLAETPPLSEEDHSHLARLLTTRAGYEAHLAARDQRRACTDEQVRFIALMTPLRDFLTLEFTSGHWRRPATPAELARTSPPASAGGAGGAGRAGRRRSGPTGRLGLPARARRFAVTGRRSVPDRFRDAVYAHADQRRTPGAWPWATSNDMDAHGRFPMDRDRYADRLGIHLTRVHERVAELRRAGLIEPLERTAPGRRHPKWVGIVPT